MNIFVLKEKRNDSFQGYKRGLTESKSLRLACFCVSLFDVQLLGNAGGGQAGDWARSSQSRPAGLNLGVQLDF